MKFVLISPKNRTVYNFRGDLVKEIIAKGYEVIVTGPDQIDVEKITTLGARFETVPVNKNGTSIIGDLKYLFKLYKLLKKEKPDVTLGYTIKPVVYGAIAAKLAGVKNINSMVTGGGYTFTSKSFKARLLSFVVRILYHFGFLSSDNIIFQNPDDLNQFCKMGLAKKEKCYTVNGSGVNMEHFTPTEYPDKITFFMLSRLLKSKGVVEYLEAAKAVKEKYPDTRFCLLGKYETAMQDAVAKEYVEQFITDGMVERFEETDDVRPYYSDCSVYVLPSYREGTPRTVLEAMAMGRPIITTDTNGCRGTVIDGKNGFLVPVKDSDKLVETMIRFIENPNLIKLMGQESINYCRDKFEVGIINREMLKILSIE